MNDELKSIEIETARIRMERERLALQDDLDRRKRSAKVADVSQAVMETTFAAGEVATGVALTATKLISKALLGALVAAALCFVWVAAQQWKGDFRLLMFDYGYWMGSGGFILVLVFAIGYPLTSSGGTNAGERSATASIAPPPGPSIFERKARLHRQLKYWLITCAVVAVGGLAHSVLPMSIGELFGGVLTMVAVALPFWALGLLFDFLRISSAKRR